MGIDVYQMVTDRMVAEIESGYIPWAKGWKGGRSGAYNRISLRPYSLLNQLMLDHQDAYLTFNQVKQKGGHVKKGAKAEKVVFWKMLQDMTGELDEDGKFIVRNRPVLKYYNVFWIGDTIGIDRPKDEELNEIQTIREPEEIIAGYLNNGGPAFHNDTPSDRAFYRPATDEVVVPVIGQYENAAEYYSTAFHELTHSTGHKSRLDRLNMDTKLAAFGSEDYSKEELVAELGAAMLCNIAGIETPETFRNSAGYLQGWLKALKNDKTLIVGAASRAEKAVKYIIGEKEAVNG